jgi:hypothetical protein
MTRRRRRGRVMHVLGQIVRILVMALAALGPGMPPPPPPPRRAQEVQEAGEIRGRLKMKR